MVHLHLLKVYYVVELPIEKENEMCCFVGGKMFELENLGQALNKRGVK